MSGMQIVPQRVMSTTATIRVVGGSSRTQWILRMILPVVLLVQCCCNTMIDAFPMTALLHSHPLQQHHHHHQVVAISPPSHPSTVVLYSSTTEATEQEETIAVTSSKVTTTKKSSSSSSNSSNSHSKSTTATLGLLTFDLDDTIYPLAPVIQEANAAFAKAMERYGFPNIQSDDITKRSVQIRNEIAETDLQLAATLSHTEIRKLAIRKEMEFVMFHRKLNECANDWATNVESLGPAVVTSARKYVNDFLSAIVMRRK